MTGGFKNKYTLNQVILFLLYLESRYSYFYYILNHADSFFKANFATRHTKFVQFADIYRKNISRLKDISKTDNLLEDNFDSIGTINSSKG